jgi:AraC-like DNA-binding protein
MDPLSDIIALLRPSAALSKPITGRGRWGVRYAAHPAPGFTIILQGECWISLEGRPPGRFQEGDFLLLPSTPPFTLSSHAGVPGELRAPSAAPVRYGEQDGDADFTALGGTFHLEAVNAPLLLALLPDLIHVPASRGRADRLHRVIDLIAQECAHEDPGKALILQRLLEILLIEALRCRDLEGPDAQASLLCGLRDPSIARALRAIHADVRANWTVAALARIAGLSRSAFAARFTQRLGHGPIEYLTRWRMALARDALIHSAKTLDTIADEIGYQSASAFSAAFRKRSGCPPKQFARASTDDDALAQRL